MKMKEIKTKSVAELTKTISEKREALRVFRFGITGAKTKNLKEGRTIRKEIARILTFLNNQENSGQNS